MTTEIYEWDDDADGTIDDRYTTSYEYTNLSELGARAGLRQQARNLPDRNGRKLSAEPLAELGLDHWGASGEPRQLERSPFRRDPASPRANRGRGGRE